MAVDTAAAAATGANEAPEGALDGPAAREGAGDIRPVLASLRHREGIATRDADAVVSVRRDAPARTFLYGPYWLLGQGGYRLRFRCDVGSVRHAGRPVLGIEVIALNRLQRAWRDFTAAELSGGGGALEFEVPAAMGVEAGGFTRFEFRFVHLGNADLRVSAVDLCGPTGDPEPVPPSRWRLLGRLRRTVLARRAGERIAVRRFEPAGCLLYGGRPYIQLAEARYRLVLRCRSARPRVPGQPVIGVEIVALRGQASQSWREVYRLESEAHHRLPIAWADFTAEELAGGSASAEFDVPLSFSLETGDAPWLEIKVFHFANADLEIAALDVERVGEIDLDNPVPRRWRLLGRVAGLTGAESGEIAVRRGDRPGPVTATLRPALELPAGHYQLRLDGRVRAPEPDNLSGSEVSLSRNFNESVIPAKAGIQGRHAVAGPWTPAFAPVTGEIDVESAPADAAVLDVQVSAAPRWSPGRAAQLVAQTRLTAAGLQAGSAALDLVVPAETARQRIGLELRHFGDADLSLTGLELREVFDAKEGLAAPGILSSRHRKVLIVGNCQAETITEAFRRAAPLRRRFDATYQFVLLEKGLRQAGRRLLEQADLLLVQDIKDWELYPLREFIPAGLETIRFPFLRFASPWPFDGYGGVNDIEAHQREWPDLTFIYLDGLLGRLRKEIPDKERRFQAYRSLAVPGILNYVHFHSFERRFLQGLDRKFGFEVGKFILDNFRQRQIFYAINHPTNEVFKVLLDWMMRRLGIDEPFTETLEHLNVVARVQVPIHPKVAAALGIEWADENTIYAYEGRRITWEQWVRAYIDHYG